MFAPSNSPVGDVVEHAREDVVWKTFRFVPSHPT